jgi:5'-phosphate synthase pdxT subunit
MADEPTLTIGVLALQGAFAEHAAMLRRAGAQAVEVRKPGQLDGLDGLILPGGESTTMGLIAERWGLVEPLRAWVRAGRPTWGTCAGMILLAERATGQKQGGQPLLGGLDVTVNRNYFGRQAQSFEVDLDAPLLGTEPVRAVFIRAPAITEIGPEVESLAALDGAPDSAAGERVHVAVRQGSLLATAFHPELTDDLRWHTLFLAMVAERRATGARGVGAASQSIGNERRGEAEP